MTDSDLLKRIERHITWAEKLTDPLQNIQALSFMKIDCQKRTKTDLSFYAKEQEPPTPNISQQRLQIQFYRSPLPSDLHDMCMELFEKNMSILYDSSNWGLDLDAKSEEFRHESARFLIVTELEEPPSSLSSFRGGGDHDCACAVHDDRTLPPPSPPPPPPSTSSSRPKLCAFSHFRFEVNDDDFPTEEVLYVYEMQVDPELQKCGIGKRCMTIMELVALNAKMRRVLLTVFKSNEKAMKFYIKRMKYKIDISSPSNYKGEEVDYEILSKSLVSN